MRMDIHRSCVEFSCPGGIASGKRNPYLNVHGKDRFSSEASLFANDPII